MPLKHTHRQDYTRKYFYKKKPPRSKVVTRRIELNEPEQGQQNLP